MKVYEFAEHMDVTAPTVYSWLDKGMPYTRKVEGRRSVIFINPKMAKKWVKENIDR